MTRRETAAPLTRRETAAPLTIEGYARTFAKLVANSTEYDLMASIARKVILENNLDKEPVRMLSIGAGRGQFETRLVREQGLKLGYIYAIEPNPAHIPLLETELKSLDAKYYIDTSFFNKEFEFDEKYGSPLFDLIMLSHCLYTFEDPFGAVSHAVKFLKPRGKILIFNQGESACSEMYTYLINHSDPNIFNTSLTHANHALTAPKITSYIRAKHPELIVSVQEDITHIGVDEFVREEDGSRNDEVVSFFLQAEYQDLSEEARKHVYEVVRKNCDVVDDKYLIRHACAGIIVSLSSHEE